MRKKSGSTSASKRGQALLDGSYILIVLFSVAIVSILSYSIYSEFNDDIQSDADISANTKAVSQNLNNRTPVTLDYVFFYVLMGLWIALIVTSYFIDTHPVWFVVVLLSMIFVFVAAIALANTYDDIATDADFVSYAADFPLMNWVFNHFLVIFIFIVLSSFITMFAKSRYG